MTDGSDSGLRERVVKALLKRIFAVFLVVMAGYILVRQAPRVLPGVFGPAPSAATAHREPDLFRTPLMTVRLHATTAPHGTTPRGHTKE